MKTISTEFLITSATTFNEIYSQYRGWLYSLANKIDNTSTHREDLIQCGRIGIAISMEKWDPARGSFFNCMYVYVYKEMMLHMVNNSNLIRKPANVIFNKEREAQPTDFVYSLDDTFLDNGEALYSTIEYDNTQYTETDTSLLIKAISMLKPQYRIIMEMTAAGENGATIAAHLGISNQAVSQQKKKAIEKLQQIMIKNK
jgi:RNA polymerase sigma factor (sigma-70 family)